jgi:hypothetical protein
MFLPYWGDVGRLTLPQPYFSFASGLSAHTHTHTNTHTHTHTHNGALFSLKEELNRLVWR